jgi:hypothetical protein
MSAPTAPPPTLKDDDSKKQSMMNWGSLAMWIAGFLTIIITLVVQVFTVDHGTSGQLTIDSGTSVGVGVGVLGFLLLAVGWVGWVVTNKFEAYKYPFLYFIAYSSYVASMIAIFFSMRQVTVANV